MSGSYYSPGYRDEMVEATLQKARDLLDDLLGEHKAVVEAAYYEQVAEKAEELRSENANIDTRQVRRARARKAQKIAEQHMSGMRRQGR